LVRLSTETNSEWTKAWRFHLILDPNNISYSTSDIRINLFQASTNVFLDWSSESSPSWKPGSNFSILQIDRKNNLNIYKWTNWLYGTILFVPIFSNNPYNVGFGMEYNWEGWTPNSTIETTLSSPFGTEIINPISQYQYNTWIYQILQQPCVYDTTNPNINISIPINWANKQTYLSWISLSLTDIGGSSTNVPYVWTGWTVGIWIRTWNIWWLDHQYGINIATFQLNMFWNGQSISLNWWTYSSPDGKTWQFLDKNYDINIPSYDLFDYWIEKEINMEVSVMDRVWRFSTTSISFNHPQGPALIPGTRSPAVNATFVSYDVPVIFGVQDDWAGVNSGSIVVTLSWINWTIYWPYVYTWNSFSLTELASDALQPNWMVEVSNHPIFPASWTILVRVAVSDMEWNIWNISDYSFVTRPDCLGLGCWFDKYLYYRDTFTILYTNNLIVSWWLNPNFYWGSDWSWYIDCWLTNQGMNVYRWQEIDSWSALPVWFVSASSLAIVWNNVKAIISWSTLILQKIFEYGSLDWGGRGWWWVYLERDDCPNWDDSTSYYDRTCEAWHGAAWDCQPTEDPSYSVELNQAYQFAYDFGITTMCPIENADMEWQLLRKHMAKMLAEFAIVIVWIYPDLNKLWCDQYDDIEYQTPETRFYAKTVCQLSLMGLESNWIDPLESFMPEEVVTRAQFWTILSRLIFVWEYNIKKWDTMDWYVKHLNALKQHKIMNKIENPWMVELRGWVMLMLKRTYESWIINKYRMLNVAANSIKVLYEF